MKSLVKALAGGAKKYFTSNKFKGSMMALVASVAMLGLISPSFAAGTDANTYANKAFNLIFGLTKMIGAGLIIFGAARIGMGILGGQEGQNLNSGITFIVAGVVFVASQWVITDVMGLNPSSFFPTATG